MNETKTTLGHTQNNLGKAEVREQATRSQRNLSQAKLSIETLRKKLHGRLNRSFINKFKHGDLIKRVREAQSMGEMKSIEQEINAKGIPPIQPIQTGEPQLPGVSFATGGTQQRNSRIPATNGRTPVQAVRRSTSSVANRVKRNPRGQQ